MSRFRDASVTMQATLKKYAIPFLVYHVGKAWMSTFKSESVGEEQIQQLVKQNGCGVILVSWHGRTFAALAKYRRRGYWTMISTSRDGEMQDRIFRSFGYHTVRGSSSARGAVQATLALIKQLKAGSVLALTPDGPRGPGRKAQPGVIYLAMKSGSPIVPVGVSAAPRKLARSWDQYMLPMPFAKVAWVYGDPIYVPADAKSPDEQEHWAHIVGQAIDAAEKRADGMVGICSEAS